MRIAVVGSRTVTDQDLVENAMLAAIEQYGTADDPIVVISGGAKGVDSLAYTIAKESNMDFILFKPYHMVDTTVEYSPRYFFSRNKQIADNADVVVILWDGKSHGTKHMVDYCRKRKKAHIITYVD